MSELRERIARHLKIRRTQAKLDYFHERRQQMLGKLQKSWYTEIVRSGWSVDRKMWREDQQKCKGDKCMDIENTKECITLEAAVDELRLLTQYHSQQKIVRLGVILDCFLFSSGTTSNEMSASTRSQHILVTLSQILHSIQNNEHLNSGEGRPLKIDDGTWKAIFLSHDSQIIWVGVRIVYELIQRNASNPSYWAVRCLLFKNPPAQQSNSYFFSNENRLSEEANIKYQILHRFIAVYSPLQTKVLCPSQILSDYLHFINGRLISCDIDTIAFDIELYGELIDRWEGWMSKKAVQTDLEHIVSSKAITNLQNLLRKSNNENVPTKMMEDIQSLCLKLLKISINPNSHKGSNEKVGKTDVFQESECDPQLLHRSLVFQDWIESNCELLQLVKSLKAARQ